MGQKSTKLCWSNVWMTTFQTRCLQTPLFSILRTWSLENIFFNSYLITIAFLVDTKEIKKYVNESSAKHLKFDRIITCKIGNFITSSISNVKGSNKKKFIKDLLRLHMANGFFKDSQCEFHLIHFGILAHESNSPNFSSSWS